MHAESAVHSCPFWATLSFDVLWSYGLLILSLDLTTWHRHGDAVPHPCAEALQEGCCQKALLQSEETKPDRHPGCQENIGKEAARSQRLPPL